MSHKNKVELHYDGRTYSDLKVNGMAVPDAVRVVLVADPSAEYPEITIETIALGEIDVTLNGAVINVLPVKEVNALSEREQQDAARWQQFQRMLRASDPQQARIWREQVDRALDSQQAANG